jgi:hypothetical protein
MSLHLKFVAISLTHRRNVDIAFKRTVFRNTLTSLMTRTIPFARSSQAALARQSKVRLLRMPRAQTDRLCLIAHVVPDAMRRGQGNLIAARTLWQTMILAGLLSESGYGTVTLEQRQRADRVLAEAGNRGRESSVWVLNNDGFSEFAVLVSTYDQQLRRAPLIAVAEASNRLARLHGGESFDEGFRKRA